MRIYHLDHPAKIRDLPVELATWALQFDAIEHAAEMERMNRAVNGG